MENEINQMDEYIKIIESNPHYIALDFYLDISGGWAAYLESIGAL